MQETQKFNKFLEKFKHFMGEDPRERAPREERDIPMDTIDSILKSQ
jgi:hypothetical protein